MNETRDSEMIDFDNVDLDEVLEAFDRLLAPHGLGVELSDDGRENYSIRLVDVQRRGKTHVCD